MWGQGKKIRKKMISNAVNVEANIFDVKDREDLQPAVDTCAFAQPSQSSLATRLVFRKEEDSLLFCPDCEGPVLMTRKGLNNIEGGAMFCSFLCKVFVRLIVERTFITRLACDCWLFLVYMNLVPECRSSWDR